MRDVVLTGIMKCLIEHSRDGLANFSVGWNQFKTHLHLDVRKQPLLKNIQKVRDLIARDARYTVGI